MRVHVVVLNWRTAPMTLRAAAAGLRALEGLEGGLTIVDNDSRDGSEEALREGTAGWPRTQVIQAGRNGGFGAGMNAGIRAGLPDGTRPDAVHLLNSDAFPEPDALRHLADHLARHPRAGIAGSLILGEDGETHLTTFRFPSVLSELEGAARTGPISRLLARHAVPLPTPEHAGPVDWCAGASMLLRTDMLDRVGLFDEAFFLYFEETDLCLRAARAGWETHFVPASRVVHLGSVSTGMKEWVRTPDYWFHSRLHYFRKNHGAAAAAAATAAHLAGGLIHRTRRGLRRQRAADPPGFLRTLLRHDLAALAPRRVPSRRPSPRVDP
ncbi:glycosyltransferase family 2 protein [Rubellimicrobium sp. CFH 75288]|uniref:glycosyltransferase family 2 protein n=1 Tax=Rubellimicrobium sp. CFH 75288 TaxID=2697034 RepID=UPI0014129FB7|nr:glycosyltransferase family 2 protein [Rubellimicrobium sp. CFH 75288]NAZ37820.1 glycosyltransferase [Rubellimicrobium sp. CFH 75288]